MDKHNQAKKTFALYDGGGDLTKNWFVYWKEGGKRLRKYGTINRQQTEEGRREAAARLLEDLQASYTPPPANAEIKKHLLEKFEEKRPTLRRTSYDADKGKLRRFLNWLGERELTGDVARQYVLEFSKTHKSATVHENRRLLHSMFSSIGRGDLLAEVKVKKGAQTPLRYFQPHQARQLMDCMAATDPALHLHCQFIYYCFLRPRSELRFLRVEDIYFEERKIEVRAAFKGMEREDGVFEVPPGSKNKRNEFVTIPDRFFPSVEPLMALPPNAFVFGRAKNRMLPMGEHQMGKRFRKLLDSFGYGFDYQLYSWKHTGAVAAVKAGISLKDLQLQLRHHSLDMVDKYLRQLGVADLGNLRATFPAPGGWK